MPFSTATWCGNVEYKNVQCKLCIERYCIFQDSHALTSSTEINCPDNTLTDLYCICHTTLIFTQGFDRYKMYKEPSINTIYIYDRFGKSTF